MMDALEALVEPLTRGDPESPLRWTCKSTRVLAQVLSDQKHSVGHVKVSHFLNDLGYSLQGNRKTEEGDDHPDRDAQFRHINAQVRQAMKKGEPVISVDTKKRNLSATMRTRGGSGEEASHRSRSTVTIFPVPKFLAPIPMGFTISGRIQDSSMSARTMTQAHSPWPPFGGGGVRKEVDSILRPNVCSLRRTEVAATAIVSDSGNGSCNAWRIRRDWRYRFITFRQEPANGIRWSTDCSPLFLRTGVESRYWIAKPSLD